MDCAEEVSLLRRELSKVAGIFDLSFDVVHARMNVEYDPERVSPARIKSAVAATGLRCDPWQQEPETAPWWDRHGRAFTTAVSGLALGAGLANEFRQGDGWMAVLAHSSHEGAEPFSIACFVLAIVAGFWWSAPRFWASLKALRPDMNVLVGVSIVGAGFLGEWSEGATLAFLFSAAALLETWSVGRARRAVTSLLHHTPSQANVVHGDHEHRMPVERLTVGAVVRVRPGERIPCDGEVVGGRSSVNQALITGESIPVEKTDGAAVFAGTMNGEGVLDIRTTRPASDTTLARMVRMVDGTGHRRAPSERFVERFARWYTPAMFALASLVGAIPPLLLGGDWSHWFYQGMVILLISCPCALVISTPVTVVSALASAARQGVLVKGGAALEEAARLGAIAFDKTGVLTTGVPEVTSFQPLNGRSENDILAWLSGLEARSEHPLGRAIVAYARRRGIAPAPTSEFRAVAGRGAEATVSGASFWAGNSRMLLDRGDVPEGLLQKVRTLEDAEHTAVICGAGTQPCGLLGITDPVRPEAPEVVGQLRAAGIRRLALLSGDNPATAGAVGGRLGLDEIRAELLPEDKVSAVAALRQEYGGVAMIGDGVNDAQALAASSLGIALRDGASDVSLETADVVLMSGGLARLPFLLRHARRALAVIRQNLILALVLKGAFLILALFGMATLWMAIVADMGATLLVTLNGLRLLRPAR